MGKKKTEIKVWCVCSPEYETYSGCMDGYYGPEPPEYGCDVVKVRGRTKREALIRGIKAMRKRYSDGWLSYADGNPWAGMEALCLSDLPPFDPSNDEDADEWSEKDILEMRAEELEYMTTKFDDEDQAL